MASILRPFFHLFLWSFRGSRYNRWWVVIKANDFDRQATIGFAAEVDGPSRMLAGEVTFMNAACCESSSAEGDVAAEPDEASAGDGACPTSIA